MRGSTEREKRREGGKEEKRKRIREGRKEREGRDLEKRGGRKGGRGKEFKKNGERDFFCNYTNNLPLYLSLNSSPSLPPPLPLSPSLRR